MPRVARIAPGGLIFHVLNRGNARCQIFEHDGDYEALERVIIETAELERLRSSAQRGQPYGNDSWQTSIAKHLGLESTLRTRGRPRKIAP